MKTIGSMIAICIAISTLAVPAAADAYKDDSVHGHWIKRYAHMQEHQHPHRHYSERRHERHGYWNGYHGHREYRSGYRRHYDGWWYPLAAFDVGQVL